MFKSLPTPSMDASSEGSDEYLSADEDCSAEDARKKLEKLRVGEDDVETARDGENVSFRVPAWRL